jgi:hypothetical protein
MAVQTSLGFKDQLTRGGIAPDGGGIRGGLGQKTEIGYDRSRLEIPVTMGRHRRPRDAVLDNLDEILIRSGPPKFPVPQIDSGDAVTFLAVAQRTARAKQPLAILYVARTVFVLGQQRTG